MQSSVKPSIIHGSAQMSLKFCMNKAFGFLVLEKKLRFPLFLMTSYKFTPEISFKFTKNMLGDTKSQLLRNFLENPRVSNKKRNVLDKVTDALLGSVQVGENSFFF